MIVTRENDFPVYELELNAQLLRTNKAFQAQPMFQFILNAALDPVEQMQWQNPYYYLKCVDRYNETPNPQGCLMVHCFVTPSNSKFLLLHESKPEDQIKNFFNDVYELYTRLLLNPFFDPNAKIDVE